MERIMDVDYIGSLSLIGGYDMEINFDGFGEELKKFMELPGKYIDAVNDKAAELIEGVSALLDVPFPDLEMSHDEAPNGEIFGDKPSENFVARALPTSVQMEPAAPSAELSNLPTSLFTVPGKYIDTVNDKAAGLIEGVSALLDATFPGLEMSHDKAPNGEISEDKPSENFVSRALPKSVQIERAAPSAELSNLPTSLITVEDDLTGQIDTDAYEVQLFPTNSPDNSSTKIDHIEVTDQCLLPVDTPTIEKCGINCCNMHILSFGSHLPAFTLLNTSVADNFCSEEIVSVGETICNEEEVSLYNSEDSRKLLSPEPSTSNGAHLLGKISENDGDQTVSCNAKCHGESTEHGNVVNLPCETLSYNLSTDVLKCADDPNTWSNAMEYDFVDEEGPQNFEGHMKNHKPEASFGPQPKNTSFKRKIMRSLTMKLRSLRSEEIDVHQDIFTQKAGNIAAALPDDLEDGWELV